MEYICNPNRVKLYVNAAKKTMQQIKAETGCDAIINAGLFDRDAFAPVAQLRVDGKTLVNENWGTNYGYAFGDTGGIKLTESVNADRNFIGCVCLVKDGKPVDKLNCPPDMQYATCRTAIGTFADGRMWAYCTKSALKPEELRSIAVIAGVRDAVMLDGGGSTQCVLPNGTITSTRIVHNFICIWGETEAKKMKIYLSPSSQPANLYSAGNTNEQTQCIRIAQFAKKAFDRCGFDCIVGEADIDFTGRTAESNRFGADIHIPIHTNAGGGHGVRVFVYGRTPARMVYAQPVYDAINAICPYKSTSGVTENPGLHEVKYSNGKCVYVEAAFHDNADEAQWIINNVEQIGEAICEGICEGAGVKYIEPKEGKPLTVEERLARLELWAKTKGFN